MALTTDEKIEEIWELFRETNRELRETNKELRESSREFDRRLKESREKFDRDLKESREEREKNSKETEEKIKKLADLFESQWGKLIEALVEPGALQLFNDRGIHVRQVARRLESSRNGEKMEIDLLLVNDNEVVIIEVKTTCKTDDVREVLEELDRFLYFFPLYKNFSLYGAVAAISIEKNVAKYAYRQGLFVLKAGKEGIIEILNDMKFKPKNFNKYLDS
jgi:hypothetical protein